MQSLRPIVPNYRLYGEHIEKTPDFWVHWETLPERTHLHKFEISAHRHESFFQIFLITSGGGEMLGGGEAMPFSAPCALFIPPGAVHGFRFARDVDGIVVTALVERLSAIVAGDRQIAEFASAPRVVPLAPDTAEAAILGEALSNVRHELMRPAAGRAALLGALMTTAVVALARAAGNGKPVETAAGDRDIRRIERLMALIGAHFREHRPVRFYAEHVGISAAHLNRLARLHTGLSVQELFAARLFEAASRELVFSSASVQNIAYSLGFSDPAYFNRFFRRMSGGTPGAFRAASRRNLNS